MGIIDEPGLGLLGGGSMFGAYMEVLAGIPRAAERELRGSYSQLEQLGERAFLSTIAAMLARGLCAQERYDEAEHYAKISADSALREDLASQVIWRPAPGQGSGGTRRAAEAEQLARGNRARKPDRVARPSCRRIDRSWRRFSPRREAAGCQEPMARAIDLYEQKGNVVAARRTRAALDRLDERPEKKR